MARPIKEGLDYFPHDTDAFNDEKIEVLRYRHGAMGYMFYFFHLERIYRSPNTELRVSDAETKQIFASKLAITEKEYEQILSTCIKYHCFDADKYMKNGILTSNGIHKRASIVIEKRNRMRHLYKGNVSDAETKQKPSRNSTETIAESAQSKVKKRRVKKSKEEDIKEKQLYKECVYLKEDEYKKMIEQFGESGTNQRIQNLNDYIMSKGIKYKSHYHTILMWERKNNGQTLACEKGTIEGKYANIHTEIIDNTFDT